MRVIQSNCWRNVLGVFELSDPLFEANDGLAKKLSSRFAFAIVVLARLALLRPSALLTSGLRAVASLAMTISITKILQATQEG
jgi:hypothetical protein